MSSNETICQNLSDILKSPEYYQWNGATLHLLILSGSGVKGDLVRLLSLRIFDAFLKDYYNPSEQSLQFYSCPYIRHMPEVLLELKDRKKNPTDRLEGLEKYAEPSYEIIEN